jgi:hypothetical protein
MKVYYVKVFCLLAYSDFHFSELIKMLSSEISPFISLLIHAHVSGNNLMIFLEFPITASEVLK